MESPRWLPSLGAASLIWLTLVDCQAPTVRAGCQLLDARDDESPGSKNLDCSTMRRVGFAICWPSTQDPDDHSLMQSCRRLLMEEVPPVVKDLEKNSVPCDWPAALALADIQDEVKRGKLAFGRVSHR